MKHRGIAALLAAVLLLTGCVPAGPAVRAHTSPGTDAGLVSPTASPAPGGTARRLVTGTGPDELYYTGDHYRSFVLVDARR
ncbi:hypothetical protein GCM10017673_43840 [Streptosporangium violaceochromogenes]|nr:hypothetical protein GCM10017673_43840 [Streptosporangium violaceochromogenes]